MVQALVQLRRGSFDPSRVRALPRGDDYWLVIDRISGAWLTLETRVAPLLPLLGAQSAELPPGVREQVASLRGILEQHAVGIAGSEKRFGGLNTMILKLTNACNFACAYCYDYEAFEHATTLPLPLGYAALEQALDLVEDELWVILHGGEPMLQWQLVESLVLAGEQLATTRGKRINFVGQSNLSRLSDRVVEFSREHRIVWGVSVDGVPQVHDRFRTDHKGRGTYDSFADALERYPGFVRRCGVMSTITAANQSRLLECARHFHTLGMPSWDWSLFQPIGRGRASSLQFHLDTEALVEAWDALFVAVESGEFDGFPVLPVKKYLQNFVSGPAGNMCMRPECGAARDLLSISANGVIEACDCIDPTGPLAHLGDLRATTLADARESPVAHAIRGRDLTKSPCAECLWFGVCGGSCLAHAPSLNDVWADGCAVAIRAFDRISASLVKSDRLVRYLASLARPAS